MNEIAFDEDSSGRRRFCRVEDEVILHFCQIPAQEADRLDAPLAPSLQPFATFFHLTEQRERMRRQLQGLRTESPKIFRCINALEQRFELIEAALLTHYLDGIADMRRPVQLSAGGISFQTSVSYKAGTVLSLQLILVPALTGIATRGRVLRSLRKLTKDRDPPYLTVVEFVDIKESTRDLIARHVFARQRRQQRGDPS